MVVSLFEMGFLTLLHRRFLLTSAIIRIPFFTLTNFGASFWLGFLYMVFFNNIHSLCTFIVHLYSWGRGLADVELSLGLLLCFLCGIIQGPKASSPTFISLAEMISAFGGELRSSCSVPDPSSFEL
ncbi:uncharacterized protein G2W53_033208 [Senna tora]|uniref:Uncharacterized protein n=1 Tax=Senna tora TaxID=362788 RepID=A0A834SZP3_9FABA|nr:uncharacterized protein G2W53_033208 [Senna tora]